MTITLTTPTTRFFDTRGQTIVEFAVATDAGQPSLRVTRSYQA